MRNLFKSLLVPLLSLHVRLRHGPTAFRLSIFPWELGGHSRSLHREKTCRLDAGPVYRAKLALIVTLSSSQTAEQIRICGSSALDLMLYHDDSFTITKTVFLAYTNKRKQALSKDHLKTETPSLLDLRDLGNLPPPLVMHLANALSVHPVRQWVIKPRLGLRAAPERVEHRAPDLPRASVLLQRGHRKRWSRWRSGRRCGRRRR
jgi:hypothetical protein